MQWNWQQPDWPNFAYDAELLAPYETTFLKQGGILIGAFKHLSQSDEQELAATLITDEAMSTSSIEGEILDRQSVRSSVLNQLGGKGQVGQIGARELGIAEMSMDVLRSAAEPLTEDMLFRWHRSLLRAQETKTKLGAYRTHSEPMQILSGPVGNQRLHFEAVPSAWVADEMTHFIEWFNSEQSGRSALGRSATAHIYFESIHPFEDGNGRIGRAISEKALAQSLGQPSLCMLSAEIQNRQGEYYALLEASSAASEITDWCAWFAQIVLAAQGRTLGWIEFIILKTKVLDRLRGRLNPRQEKALLRLFREGPSGFAAGLSSGKYQTLTGASPASAGRDLSELVELGAMYKTGVGKGTRYRLVQQAP